MEQQLLGEFLEITAENSPSLHALSLARSLIINPSTSETTISSIFQTLTLLLQPNQNPNAISLHHIFSLLSDLSIHWSQFRRPIFTALYSFSLLPNNSTRSATDALSLLISIAELDQALLPSVAELSEGLFLSLCFRPCVAVRHYLLLNVQKLSIRPSLLLTVLLGFTKDPYPYIRSVSLDGLSNCIVTEDRGMMEGCYVRAVELLSDREDCVRRSAIRAVRAWGQVLVVSSKGESKKYWSDALFKQICSMVRDMSSVDVRFEAFDSLGKIEMVSEDILLQTLSKKPAKGDEAAEAHLKIPLSSAAGVFIHGIEDEYCEVRGSACSSLRSLSILSSDFAGKALNLLVDLLNDDSEVVRLQTLQTLHHIAKQGHQVQEDHLNMVFGTLHDNSTPIRSEAMKVIQMLKLHSSAMFKQCISVLVNSLEVNPQDEADIFSVLFNIGRSHGSYAVSLVEDVSHEIDQYFEGKLGFGSARTASLLVLAISAPLSHEKHLCSIPPRIFSYAVTLLGRISRGVVDFMDQNTLLLYLCSCSRSTFVSALDLFNREKPLQQIENDASNSHSQESCELTKTTTPLRNCQLELNDEGTTLVNHILASVNNIWSLVQFGCISEVLQTLRIWKKELEVVSIKAPQRIGRLVFALKYLQVVKLLGKAWMHFTSQRKPQFTGEFGITLRKLYNDLREMKHTFVGLNKEAELHLLELMLVTCLLKFPSFEPSCHQFTVNMLPSTLSCVELLLEEGSIEPSKFVIELKKSLHEIGTSIDRELLFKKLVEFFCLKQFVLCGGLKHIKAELDVIGNDCENPFCYVPGLPVGIPLQIILYNVVPENRLWLRFSVNQESCQYVYLDSEQFGDNDAVKKFTYVAPFYRTPKADCFTLTVSLGMECVSAHDLFVRKCRGPKHELAYLCKEKEVYLSMIVK